MALPEPRYGLFTASRSVKVEDGLETGMFGFGPFRTVKPTQDSTSTTTSISDNTRLIPLSFDAHRCRAYDTELKTRSTVMGSSGTHFLISRYQRFVIDARPFLDLLVYHPFDSMVYKSPIRMRHKSRSMMSISGGRRAQDETLLYSPGLSENEAATTAKYGHQNGRGCSMHRLVIPREVFEPRDIHSPMLEKGGFHFDDRLGIVYILRDDGLVFAVHYV